MKFLGKPSLLTFALLALAGCATQDAHYQDLAKQAQSNPDSVDYAELRSSLLKSEKLLAHINETSDIEDEIDKLRKDHASCDRLLPLLDKLLASDPGNFPGHYLAMRCYDQQHDGAKAAIHEKILGELVKSMTRDGDGSRIETPIKVRQFLEADTFVELSGYKKIGYAMDFSDSHDGLYYVFVVNEPDTGKQTSLYFDASEYLKAYGKQLFKNQTQDADEALGYVLNSLARQGDTPAQLALGKLLLSNSKEDVRKKGREYITQAAENGDVIAKHSLALFYLNGKDGFEKNLNRAIDNLMPGVEAGYVWSQLRLAKLYDEGHGVPKDATACDALIKEAALALDPGEAERRVAMFYRDDGEGEKDGNRHVYWLEKAMALNNLDAINERGLAYENGLGSKADQVKANALYLKAANAGLAVAQTNLGNDLYRGDGAEKDIPAAMRWFEKAAAQHDGRAQNYLGEIYQSGADGVPPNPALARHYFQLAADNQSAWGRFHMARMLMRDIGLETTSYAVGHPELLSSECPKITNYLWGATRGGIGYATNDLGLLYWNGQCGTQNKRLAAYLFILGAEFDNAPAAYNIATMLKNGDGIPRSPEHAFTYFKKAAELAPEDGSYQAMLAWCYKNAFGTPADYDKAAALAKQSADAGDDTGQTLLGQLYRDGQGVTQDTKLAKQWLAKAAKQGNSAAINDLRALGVVVDIVN